MRLGTVSLALAILSAHAGMAWAQAADHQMAARIDALILAKANGKPASLPADDAEFLRRAYLDFGGRIPSASEARKFLADKAGDKRTRLIDQLLASPEHPRRMQELFTVMLMERLGEHAEWTKYLHTSFEQNKPWDQMVRDMLGGASAQSQLAGAVFFLAKRLENYGQNPVDYPALTRDIGRLFLGQNLQCAQCHDHLTIKDYRQGDFQGLYVFVKNVALRAGSPPGVTEKPTTEKIEFVSVFGGDKMKIGPRVPGRAEIAIPSLKKGEEYQEKPDPNKKSPGVLKFSTLAKLSEQVAAAENQAFNRNIVNRLWFMLMGRGLVHPLDLHHSGNPPSHPELLDLLAREMVVRNYDIKSMLRVLALTQTYQRSSRLPAGEKEQAPGEFRTALERRLEAEQLLRALLEATGEISVKGGATFTSMRPVFLKAFAYAPREPEEEFSPSLKGALFLLNDKSVLGWLEPKPGNLVERLQKLGDDKQVAQELYLSVLTRLPTAAEVQVATKYLGERKDRRAAALRNLAWSLLGSTEFCVNH